MNKCILDSYLIYPWIWHNNHTLILPNQNIWDKNKIAYHFILQNQYEVFVVYI